MTTLLIEPFGGMAGDMLLAALLDLDDPRFTLETLRELAGALVPGECRLAREPARRGAIAATLFTVETAESAHPPHRHFADLEALVRAAPLSERERERTLAVLWCIAEAEGRVHAKPPEEIHFHEVGAVDTLVDVAGAVRALERLEVTRVLSTPPISGAGSVRCAHGELPVPAPAVVEILRERPFVLGGGGGERTTPTGAALLATLADAFEAPGASRGRAVGYGAGRADFAEGPPNLVRVQLLDVAGTSARRGAWLLEVNLDDMTGEELAHAAHALREAGALDVWSSPVQMKKDRPGCVLSVLAREERRAEIERAVFDWTTTLGVRWTEVVRTECERSTIEVALDGHAVRVKVRHRPPGLEGPPFGERDLAPEHEDVARLARESGKSLRELHRAAVRLALERLREQ